MRYRAIVSITFNDDDLAELGESLGLPGTRLNPLSTIEGCLDNLELGTPWVEQFYEDGHEIIARLSEGMTIEIGTHEERS